MTRRTACEPSPATRKSLAEAAAIYAAIERVVRCPWNPFPADSPWGLQIDEGYRRDLAGERIARRIRSRFIASSVFGGVR